MELDDMKASPEEAMRFERRDLIKELREQCDQGPFSISLGGVPNQSQRMEFDRCRIASLWTLQKVIAHLERIEELEADNAN